MSLPIYHTLNVKSTSLEDISGILAGDLNLKYPLALNLKSLDFESQRELIGLIENYFVSHNISYKFPYPIYLICDHEPSITQMPVVKSAEELPKFFVQKESKMNVKESHLVSRNKLLQQEIRNTDSAWSSNEIYLYGEIHKQIYEQDQEREFLRHIQTRLIAKGRKNG